MSTAAAPPKPPADWTATLAHGQILVFGGPYSNLAATRAMRAEADRRAIPPANVICTGDVVAYAAEPEATVQLIRAWGCLVIAGNCEEQLGVGAADCGCGFEEGTACNTLSLGWYPYADRRVSAASRAWMRELPSIGRFTRAGRTFTVVHGGVRQTNRFLFASEHRALREELATAGTDVVIAGHAGIPFIAPLGDQVWFNPGVIGMPANDGTTDVWYGLIDLDAGGDLRLETHRLAYDHGAAATAMRRHAYADSYAETLLTGIWPSLDVLPATEKAQTGQRLPTCAHVLPAPSVLTAEARYSLASNL